MIWYSTSRCPYSGTVPGPSDSRECSSCSSLILSSLMFQTTHRAWMELMQEALACHGMWVDEHDDIGYVFVFLSLELSKGEVAVVGRAVAH